MASKTQLAKSRIQSRVALSKALIRAMGMEPDVYERIALNALLTAPGIAECDPESIDRAVRECVEMRLVPDGRQAAIVPFRGRAQLIPMIEGRLLLARRATPGVAFRARLVYADDVWEHEEGLDVRLVHRPDPFADRRDSNVVAAYAIAGLPGGGEEWVVLYRSEIDRYRRFSASAGRKGSPWDAHFGEMALKTVLGVLCKRLPKVPGQPSADPFEQTDQTGSDGGVVVDVKGGVDVAAGLDAAPAQLDRPPSAPSDDVPPSPPDDVDERPPPARSKPRAKAKAKRAVAAVDATAPVGDEDDVGPPEPTVLADVEGSPF